MAQTSKTETTNIWGLLIMIGSLLFAGAALWARRQMEFSAETLERDAKELQVAPSPTPAPITRPQANPTPAR